MSTSFPNQILNGQAARNRKHIVSAKNKKNKKEKQLSPTTHSPKNEMSSSSRLPAPLVLVGTDSS
jgi:hypothetical protein